jgi:glycerophosphoryl diester phosphodiesterase
MLKHKEGKKWIAAFFILLLSIIIFEALFLVLIPMHWEFNDYLSDKLGFSANYALIIILIFCIPLIYSIFFLIRNLVFIKRDDKADPALINKILSIAFFIITIALLVTLILLFGEDSVVIVQLLEYYSMFLFTILIAGIIVLLYPLLPEIVKFIKKPIEPLLKQRAKKYSIISFFFIFYIWILIMPVIFQPTNVLKGELPQKPLIIAHRGGAHYAPENTIAAGIYTSTIQAAGWEIDVRISNDGIPFLMHDSTLERTTNVSEEFPSRVDDNSESFTIFELKQLNAGKWFVDEDPHDTIKKGKVSSSLLETYQVANIPTLEEALNYSRDNGLIVNVDFYSPPNDHPYYDQYFDRCFSVLASAGIDEMIWLTSYNEDWLDYTMSNAPNMIAVLSVDLSDDIDLEEFKTQEYDMINTHHGRSNKLYKTAIEDGISINVWTVDLVSRFQQLWALGVSSVTTNEPIVFIEMTKPNWIIQRQIYIVIWIIVDLIGVSSVLGLRYIRSKKQPS